MIIAQLATFPLRRGIMLETVRAISGQVDQLRIALNEYTEIPDELTAYGNVVAIIPERNIKDVGKFFFDVAPDDIIFTIDDDISYPPDYIERTLAQADAMGLDDHVFGYQGNAWVYKKDKDAMGWRNYLFFKECNAIIELDIIGTGTACFLGKNCPDFGYMESSVGFCDYRFSLYQRAKGNKMWTLPRERDYLSRNLPEHLLDTSIFNTVTRQGSDQISVEIGKIIECSPETTGLPYFSKKRS